MAHIIQGRGPTPASWPPLYDPRFEHDACGVGFLTDQQGRASHELLQHGLAALTKLTHRGAVGAARLSIDGTGILADIPWALLDREVPNGRGRDRARAAGMLFVPPSAAGEVRSLVEDALRAHGWHVRAWREVPVHREILGPAYRENAPLFQQVIVGSSIATAERDLYRARLHIERLARERGLDDFAIASLSPKTIVYKALVDPENLPRFYPDLADAAYATRLIVFHQRFSTNTYPRWELAQPFHLIAHNGEINTIQGNRLWMQARLRDPRCLPGFDQDRPGGGGAPPLNPVRDTGSDSQSLDDAVALLRSSGFSLPHAFARLIPPAFERANLPADERAFFEYQATFNEPWDGPAALACTDGRYVGALVDRNGFRPSRMVRSIDGLIGVGSEAGIFEIPESHVAERGRLGPGEMLFVDVERGLLHDAKGTRQMLAMSRPYVALLHRAVAPLASTEWQADERIEWIDDPALRRVQKLFGCSREELEVVLRPMALESKEAVGSMGDDTPPAMLSSRSRLLPDFFRQRFAQVTNPPLDALREASVLSLATLVGTRGHYLDEDASGSRLVKLSSPILTCEQFRTLTRMSGLPMARLSLSFTSQGRGPTAASVSERGAAFRAALDTLAARACDAVRNGAALLVLSDRDVDADRAPLPPLLAVAAVHERLIAAGCRARTSVVVETAEARDSHQVATLCAYGAAAVYPYLGYLSAASMARARGRSSDDAVSAYRGALEQGLLKIMSKMGVCTFSGYCGGQLFEILGLDRDLVQTYFPATHCTIGHVSLDDIAAHAIARHRSVYGTEDVQLEYPGFHGFRRDGEYHAYNPTVIKALHRAAGSATSEAYQHFTSLVHERPPAAIRDLLEFVDGTPIPIEDVESADDICRRFFASAMSVGALSPEAHRVIAIAMNRLGGRSNSGEGGEEPERYLDRGTPTSSNCETKQVASARFGVTPAYLISASELQIKMAQGSKPGEGGQLPGEKNMAHIARLRHAQPGIPLISPPPHHDIYSIEDLAQLIYDLKSFNPGARINVKLVAQAGVGIVAAGCVKAGADAIQISGHDGGTGASPRGSIKHAGVPWELGLAETQQVLTLKGMRGRVIVQTDGGLKTGRDVAMAAALGADEYGFGTAAVVAIGCVMARQCHLNTCPVGVATQRADLRAKFAGTPDMAISYFRLLAAEVRAILARLGLRTLHELVGRVDLLKVKPATATEGLLDLSALLTPVQPIPVSACANAVRPSRRKTLNEKIARRASTLLGRQPMQFFYRVKNTDRAVGARLAGAIAERFGNEGVPLHPVRLVLSGSAGQSFGAFTLPGMRLELTGEANDCVGKGMHGGEIVIRAPRRGPAGGVLVGNTVLYGATGGRLFVAGGGGERFAVRNSGAMAVVEGIGDHGCEYMTGGTVVVLGAIGRNFAAGMTGGRAFVYDPTTDSQRQCNQELSSPAPLTPADAAELNLLIAEHYERTRSALARRLLDRWATVQAHFWKYEPVQLAEQVAPVDVETPVQAAIEEPIPVPAPVVMLPISDGDASAPPLGAGA
jgi:glutamate synthase (ferredoxin)